MELAHRRWLGRLAKLGLVLVAIVIVLAWIQRKSPVRGDLRLQSDAPVAEALGAGDVRIFNRDSSVNLILQGTNVLAGLSPQTVERVRAKLEESTAKDTSGLGGSLAQLVKSAVAGAIGTHVVYPLADIRDIRYVDGQLVLDRRDGSTTELFGNMERDREEIGKTFAPDDARRFIEAVRTRKQELGHR